MTASVTVRHTFEAGHRLPHLNGKCQSLHGHSWQVAVTVAGDVNPDGVLVEFAALKKHLRGWVDHNLDHGLMLGTTDPLARIMPAHGKVFLFGAPDGPHGMALAEYVHDLAWPTVENVAALIARVMQKHLAFTGETRHAYVSRVDVQETAVNCATWTPS